MKNIEHLSIFNIKKFEKLISDYDDYDYDLKKILEVMFKFVNVNPKSLLKGK